jgi:hypothetical protein
MPGGHVRGFCAPDGAGAVGTLPVALPAGALPAVATTAGAFSYTREMRLKGLRGSMARPSIVTSCET